MSSEASGILMGVMVVFGLEGSSSSLLLPVLSPEPLRGLKAKQQHTLRHGRTLSWHARHELARATATYAYASGLKHKGKTQLHELHQHEVSCMYWKQ